MVSPDSPVALVTGAARRIGAVIARTLHGDGMRVVVHHNRSVAQADALVREFELARPGSAVAAGHDLLDAAAAEALPARALEAFGRLDLLVNNASTFYETPIGTLTPAQFDDLVGTNLRAPLFLSQAAAPALSSSGGSIVSIADIWASRALAGYAAYCAAKAGLVMLTRCLAAELAPRVRVNAIAPGAILWPEGDTDAAARERMLETVPLGRMGDPADIAGAVLYLHRDAGYVTGQVLTVDGGRHL